MAILQINHIDHSDHTDSKIQEGDTLQNTSTTTYAHTHLLFVFKIAQRTTATMC